MAHKVKDFSIDGSYIERDATPEEVADLEERKNNKFNVMLENLRMTRDRMIAQTDYLALSDQTMTAEMTTYRQALRDITNGLTTVEDVEAVVFPEKPGA